VQNQACGTAQCLEKLLKVSVVVNNSGGVDSNASSSPACAETMME
jgi:hypothetical protein